MTVTAWWHPAASRPSLYYDRDGARMSLSMVAGRMISAKHEKAQEQPTELRQGPIDATEVRRPCFDAEAGP